MLSQQELRRHRQRDAQLVAMQNDDLPLRHKSPFSHVPIQVPRVTGVNYVNVDVSLPY